MTEENKNDVKIHGDNPSLEGKLNIENDVLIVVTQAFCPNGHNIVGHGTHDFDGNPGICVNVSDGNISGMVEISPIHGDKRKYGPDFEAGKKVKVTCPVCDTEFEVLGKCSCDTGELRKIYLSPKLRSAYMISVCDQWGCYLSRVIDDNELFSEFVENWD